MYEPASSVGNTTDIGIVKMKEKLSLVITLVTFCMVFVCGISVPCFTIIGCRIIRWDSDLHQNVASNTLYLFPLKTKNCYFFFFYQITLNQVFSKSCFPNLCMVSQITSSHILFSFFKFSCKLHEILTKFHQKLSHIEKKFFLKYFQEFF